MTGSRFVNRRRDPVYQTAVCRGCRQERGGWTRFESMSYGEQPAGRAIHFCDECDARLLASERPLDAVLMDHLQAP